MHQEPVKEIRIVFKGKTLEVIDQMMKRMMKEYKQLSHGIGK